MSGTSRPLDSGRTDTQGRKIKVSEPGVAGRADAPAPSPGPLPASEGLDYGNAAPKTSDGQVIDLTGDVNFGIRASSPYDRGEPFNDEDYVYETDEWAINHAGNGTFETDRRGRTVAYLPVLRGRAGGGEPVKVTEIVRWRTDAFNENDAGRIWRNRGLISRLVRGDRTDPIVADNYLRVTFNDDGTMTVTGQNGVYATQHPAAR